MGAIFIKGAGGSSKLSYQTGTVTTTPNMRSVPTDKTPTLLIVSGRAGGGNEQRYALMPTYGINAYKYGSAWTDATNYCRIVEGGFQIKGFNNGNVGTLNWLAIFEEFE